MTQGILEDRAKQVWHGPEICRLDADGSKGTASDVELVPKADIDVRYLGLGRSMSRPLRQRLEQLLCRYEEMGDTFLDLRELLRRLMVTGSALLSDERMGKGSSPTEIPTF